MPTVVANVNEKGPAARPRKANECLAEAKRLKPPAELFDEFWREGELALFFAAAGTGKSLLAFQVADALARGTPLHGFVMPKNRRKVWYVDLSLSDAQFHSRYGRYKFAENLYREAPPDGADVCDWIERMAEENNFRVVIVDDLSAIKRTHDGIRETLAFMRRLRHLRGKLGVSILVLSDAFEPSRGGPVSENDLRRSRVLCTAADSVFAIGRKRRPDGGRCIVQTRSRSAEVFWEMQNAPVGEIKLLYSGLLGFEFDERFTPEMDEDKLRLICEISRLHKAEGKPFREIGRQLGISKSWAFELYQKWTPAIDRGIEEGRQLADDPKTPVLREAVGSETPLLSEEGSPRFANGVVEAADDESEEWDEADLEKPVWWNIETTPDDNDSELKSSYDSRGDEIFVESEDHTGKPTIWYKFETGGTKIRYERKTSGIIIERLPTGNAAAAREVLADR